MASGSASREYHSSVGTTADTVTLGAYFRTAVVFNRGTTNLYVTAGTDQQVPATPVAAAAETWVVPANTSRLVVVYGEAPSASNATSATQTVVKVISDAVGPTNYSVVGN